MHQGIGQNAREAGWGGRIRTCDHGTKTRCLTAWLHPIGAAYLAPRRGGFKREIRLNRPCSRSRLRASRNEPAGRGPAVQMQTGRWMAGRAGPCRLRDPRAPCHDSACGGMTRRPGSVVVPAEQAGCLGRSGRELHESRAAPFSCIARPERGRSARGTGFGRHTWASCPVPRPGRCAPVRVPVDPTGPQRSGRRTGHHARTPCPGRSRACGSVLSRCARPRRSSRRLRPRVPDAFRGLAPPPGARRKRMHGDDGRCRPLQIV